MSFEIAAMPKPVHRTFETGSSDFFPLLPHHVGQVLRTIGYRGYVHEELLAKAKRREALLFVWRRANFWRLPTRAVGVLLRSPSNAQGSYISREERAAIVKFLAKRLAAGI